MATVRGSGSTIVPRLWWCKSRLGWGTKGKQSSRSLSERHLLVRLHNVNCSHRRNTRKVPDPTCCIARSSGRCVHSSPFQLDALRLYSSQTPHSKVPTYLPGLLDIAINICLHCMIKQTSRSAQNTCRWSPRAGLASLCSVRCGRLDNFTRRRGERATEWPRDRPTCPCSACRLPRCIGEMVVNYNPEPSAPFSSSPDFFTLWSRSPIFRDRPRTIGSPTPPWRAADEPRQGASRRLPACRQRIRFAPRNWPP